MSELFDNGGIPMGNGECAFAAWLVPGFYWNEGSYSEIYVVDYW